MTLSTLFVSTSSGGMPGHRGSIMRFGLDDGKVISPDRGRSSPFPSPSFMVWSGTNERLYITSELVEGAGLVTDVGVAGDDFQIADSVPTGANAAVHLCLDRRERHVLVANYQAERDAGDVSLAAFELGADGSIGAMTGWTAHQGSGPDAARQQGPHCHCVTIHPDNRVAAAADLGTDIIYFYRFDPLSGTIALSSELALPPGTGPRHCAFHPTLPILYVSGELDSSFITVKLNDSASGGRVLDRIAATESRAPGRNYPSGIAVTPDGHHVILANRGADTLATFYIDPASGRPGRRVETPCGGKFPRSIRLDQSGRFLAVANQKSDNVTIFGWDFAHGAMSKLPLSTIAVSKPYDALIVDQ